MEKDEKAVGLVFMAMIRDEYGKKKRTYYYKNFFVKKLRCFNVVFLMVFFCF